MKNIPVINPGIVAVSRDCFPIELSQNRKTRVLKECQSKNIPLIEIKTIVENEKDTLKALEELKRSGDARGSCRRERKRFDPGKRRCILRDAQHLL
jgi:L-fucose isomerase-like protein